MGPCIPEPAVKGPLTGAGEKFAWTRGYGAAGKKSAKSGSGGTSCLQPVAEAGAVGRGDPVAV